MMILCLNLKCEIPIVDGLYRQKLPQHVVYFYNVSAYYSVILYCITNFKKLPTEHYVMFNIYKPLESDHQYAIFWMR